jgi:Gti1/Pac2 family
MEQSQDEYFPKIDITHTIEKSIAPRITQDITPSHICAISSGNESRLLPPPGLRGDQYTLIRLSKIKDEKILKTLDTKIGTVNEVPNIEELNDGSWEICILKSHRRTVKDTLGKIFPGSDVDLYYDPLIPTANDSEVWGYDKAKMLCKDWFFERAIKVVREGWPAGAAYYAYRLKVMSGLASDFTLVPTYQGCLQSKEDAIYLLKSCLRGKLAHSTRGPRDGEATISGNIFVWEANVTGIDCWGDGMEWTIREEDGFEVGEAIDGSGLMKKTISIPESGRIHHVVSYYTASDARTLRPVAR